MGCVLGIGAEGALTVLLWYGDVQPVPATVLSIMSGLLVYAGWVQARHVRA
jgi:hypothetical protein